MTFPAFESLVKDRYPEAEVYPHGSTKNSIAVQVQFKPGGKTYSYNGSYCYVLNRLGIKAIYEWDLRELKHTLELLIRTDGEPNPFDLSCKPMDNSERIEELRTQIREYETNYLVIN